MRREHAVESKMMDAWWRMRAASFFKRDNGVSIR